MLTWLKKHYSQVAEKNWYACESNDEEMLRPCTKDVKNQLKQQNLSKLNKTIHALGFFEGKDYDGKTVLKNSVPLRKQISLKQTAKLIKKLNTTKSSSLLPGSDQTHSKHKNKQNLANPKKQNTKNPYNITGLKKG